MGRLALLRPASSAILAIEATLLENRLSKNGILAVIIGYCITGLRSREWGVLSKPKYVRTVANVSRTEVSQAGRPGPGTVGLFVSFHQWI